MEHVIFEKSIYALAMCDPIGAVISRTSTMFMVSYRIYLKLGGHMV